MNIIIKGMEMPKSCWVCNFCRHFDEPNQGFFCLILEEKVDYESSSLYTKGSCPLVPVPKHGRLIDADAAYEQFLNLMDTQGAINPCQLGTILVDAPTIIPAEEGE